MQKFLIIQTAFIGDAVLATALIEKLHQFFPDARIDFLVRKGNEALLAGHPWLHEVLIWDKKEGKLKNLWKIGRLIRARRYDKVINVQRFAATGLLTAFSGAKETIGFDKNPLSRFFARKVPHIVSAPTQPGPGSYTGTPLHEIDRNQLLIKDFTDDKPARPRLYPTQKDEEKVQPYMAQKPYITISPASVWFTKQYPKEKWVAFIKKLPDNYNIYLLGAPSDKPLTQFILNEVQNLGGTLAPNPGGLAAANPNPGGTTPKITDLSGHLSFLQSAALMRTAAMNYVNDSAPMHFASAVNAPVTAVYCSTIPGFGFGPLSDIRHIVEIKEPLDCRPCGLHGYKACPRGHFNCAWKIEESQLIQSLITSRPDGH